MTRARYGCLLGALLGGYLATAAAEAPLSEDSFLGELPVVLSVIRLAQPLDEAPAAVTVIDRETIQRSGARDVTDVLRLVPGFIVSHIESGARPMATYHAEYDAITRHMQVLIDGRSVYSSLLVGTSNNGLMGVILDDIERIEVLRGSNSAAFGANAFLGVVNIVTRHAAETRGGMVAATMGEAGVTDGTARLGWGDERAAFRLTVASQRDKGFDNFNDDRRIEQAHFRGDLHLSPAADLMLTAGRTRYSWGLNDKPPRTESWHDNYIGAQLTRRLHGDEHVKLNAQFDEERYLNFIPYLPADGIARRTELGGEHGFSTSREWRFVWGGQYRHEQVISSDLFAANPDQRFAQRRLFGNAEWKPHPQWVANAGAMWEHHSIAGAAVAPRLAVNFHVLPGHTVRVGTTTSYKQPTLFELRTDWRDNGVPLFRASGAAHAERIDAQEVGYLGEFRALNLGVDVRLFEEHVRDLLRYRAPCGGCPNDVVNQDSNKQSGWETQLRWRPAAKTEILANYTKLHLDPDAESTAPQDRYRAPSHNAMLALFQRLPGGFDFSVIHTAIGGYFYVRNSDRIPGHNRTDLRLARQFSIGATRVEAALTVRAFDGGHIDFVERGLPPMYLRRQALATLRLEY